MQTSAAQKQGARLRRLMVLSALLLSAAACGTVSGARTYIATVRVGETPSPAALAVDFVWTENEEATRIVDGVSNWFAEKEGILTVLPAGEFGVASLEVVPNYAGDMEFETKGLPEAIFVFVGTPSHPQSDLVRRLDGDEVSVKSIYVSIENDDIQISAR